MPKFYLTTPIYYVNAGPHIGHTFTTLAAESIAMFKRMQGYDVVLTTGTDEHGTKIERASKAAGKSPMEFTTAVSNEFRYNWDQLGIRLDRFLRTTDPEHAKNVQQLFLDCQKNGFVYKGSYTGMYCVSDELYVNDAKAGDKCPECGRALEEITEENYFFKLSAFTDRLIEFHTQNPEFVQPETRRNEVLAFLKQGLSDLSISRTTIKWGIPVPGEEKHVFYVWFDALMTYWSAVKGEDRWPADLHLMSKEILRFHAIYWPAFLLAAGWPLPKKVFVHGWMLIDNEKMSKSSGNLVRPIPIKEVLGLDALRYFLLREAPFGQDINFSYDAIIARYNGDLANGLGNLASRVMAMIQQYRAGIIPAGSAPEELVQAANETVKTVIGHYEKYEFSRALEATWALISRADKLIVERAPWKLAKDPAQQALLDDTLYTAAEVVRLAAILAYPVLPQSTTKIYQQLGFSGAPEQEAINELAWGQLPAAQKTGEPSAVFPRIDAKQAVDRMFEMEEQEKLRQNEILGKKPESEVATTPALIPGGIPLAPEISIDDFVKVDLRVGLVVFAEKLEKSDKLLHLKIDLGEGEPRTILAGMQQFYSPEQVLNRKVVVVANLAPRKMRGIMSQGMVVAASVEGGDPVLAGFLEEVPIGARLK
jgi:methionyl-tRNA synthetase